MTNTNTSGEDLFRWRLWAHPARLAGIQALLSAPGLPEARLVFEAKKASSGRLAVVTAGQSRAVDPD